MEQETNQTEQLLLDLSLIRKDSVELLSPSVRDREDVGVKVCNHSKIIYLSKDSHISNEYYENNDSFSYWNAENQQDSFKETETDDLRRAQQFNSLLKGKSCLDFGTGNGRFLELIKNSATKIAGVEIQNDVRDYLIKNGYNIKKDIEEFGSEKFDVISMFHVLEHLKDPINTLKNIRKYLKEDGILIAEVPHAGDFLISKAENKSFKNFTFWSEHLILHTKGSLGVFMEKAGFRNIEIIPTQRFPISNHLFWLAKGIPGGHIKWDDFNNAELIKAYEKTLIKLNLTDTLISIAKKQ